MIRNIRRRYFEVWGNEEAQNSILKGILIVLGVLCVVQSISLVFLSLRKPVLVAIGNAETQVFKSTPPPEELLSNELKRVLNRYVETHYSWSPGTIEKAHSDAAKYVGEKFVKAFNVANSEQIKIAKEKKVSQKIYVSDISIDAKALSARVTMDRFLVIEGLRATSPLILDITFEHGSRTAANPEGVYITGEKVVNSQ